MEEKISVVMATYNGAKYLEKQLDSILKQSYAANELIVSDDHSTDGTQDILNKHKDLNVYQNKNARGVISNFKYAASKANSANYLAFSDQDDIWLSEKLLLCLKALKSIETEKLPCLVYSDPIVINSKDEVISESLWSILGFNQYEHKLPTILFGNPAGGCTMLVNPELAKYISTIPNDCLMHDAWLTLVAYTFGKALVLAEPVLKYRQHETNVTFSEDYKKHSRVTRVLNEIKLSLKGKSDLFSEQFIFVRKFYNHFVADLTPDKKVIFESFLKLENKSYLHKKLAFRRAMKA
ncbi:glycosyltransferase [Pedobacter aquatilis]|uniref:glycosyltransferase n=1 Tax=Pedobacter aquatilis TaxID=351343 RepID=UPI00292FFC27|nr:glycosyltransferase [Pedobacter aquatilis]